MKRSLLQIQSLYHKMRVPYKGGAYDEPCNYYQPKIRNRSQSDRAGAV